MLFMFNFDHLPIQEDDRLFFYTSFKFMILCVYSLMFSIVAKTNHLFVRCLWERQFSCGEIHRLKQRILKFPHSLLSQFLIVFQSTLAKRSGSWAIRDISTRYSVYILNTYISDYYPEYIAFPLMEVSRGVDGGIEKGEPIPLKFRLRGIPSWQESCSTSGRRLSQSEAGFCRPSKCRHEIPEDAEVSAKKSQFIGTMGSRINLTGRCERSEAGDRV
jgi:hypothetical protein